MSGRSSISSGGTRDDASDLPAPRSKFVVEMDTSDSEREDLRVAASRFDTWHDNWDEFFTSFKTYQEQTSQLYRVRTSVKAAARNQVIKRKKSWSKKELIPESFGDYYKKFVCTHGWEKSNRGKGVRTGHQRRSTGCAAVLCATVSFCSESGAFRVCVTQHKRTHNHHLKKSVYERYPSNRKITDPDVLDFVDELTKAGGKPKKILKYLQESSGKRVTLRDVHNLVQRLKSKRRGSGTIEDRLEAVFREFCAIRDNTATVFVDDSKQTQTIVWQSRQMRRFFEAFPEVVMLDSTHGTNASKYKLFSFMIDDVFGHGQYVQHSLVENESHACMKDAIDAFKENNPSWDRIRAIMIDKDFGEISLLKKEFPLARVLICHFHLKKYLWTEMSKAIYGGRDAVDVDRVEDAVDMMVKSHDEKEYGKGLRYMYYVLDGFDDQDELPEPKHPLLVHFIRNWDSCKEMWAVYERGHVAHLGNHANNRLESAWGDLKKILRPEMELDECVETLIFLQSTAELEYASQFHVIGSRHYQGADDILLRLAALVSSHAFNLVRKEYELFKGGSLDYGGRWLQDGMVQLRSNSTQKEYVVNTKTYTCSCFFMRTMLLPCRHTIFVRSNLKKKKLIPINYIHPRWLLQSEANRPDEDESDDGISCSAFRVQASHMKSVRHAVLNGSTKWRAGMDVAERVVEAMSFQGTSSFLGLVEALRKFEEYASQGVVPVFEPVKKGNNRGVDGACESSGIDTVTSGANSDDSDDSSLPATFKSKAKPLIDDSDEETNDATGSSKKNAVNSELKREQEGPLEALVLDGARLIADTERIIRRSREIISSGGESDTSARVKSATRVTNQLGKIPNQLVNVPNQLVKTPKELVNSTGQLKIRKRDSKSFVHDIESSSSSEECERLFKIIQSTKSKGRPKIRKKQQREGKRLRMEASLSEADALVQGTLVPVKDLSLVRKTLAHSYNVTDALPVLRSITQVDAQLGSRQLLCKLH